MKRMLALLSGSAISVVLFASTAPSFSFHPIGGYPNAAVSYPRGLNISRTVVGSDLQSDGNYHGYVEIRKRFQTVQPAGAISSYLQGISDKGEMVGGYCDTLNCAGPDVQHGFLFGNGKYTKLDYPTPGTSLAPEGINNLGEVVGGYCPSSTACSGGISPSNHAFLLVGGVYTTLDYPGAIGTQANAINDSGTIVGFYEEPSTQQHGYMYANGVFTTLDFPGANWTYPAGIDNAGTVAGSFQDSNLIVHGFVYGGGIFTQVDVPSAFSTAIGGFNNKGEITATGNVSNTLVNYIGIPVK